MKINFRNKTAVQHTALEDDCQKCAFYSESLCFCISLCCDINGRFEQIGISEDIFKL